jgi:hypothetical protein
MKHNIEETIKDFENDTNGNIEGGHICQVEEFNSGDKKNDTNTIILDDKSLSTICITKVMFTQSKIHI